MWRRSLAWLVCGKWEEQKTKKRAKNEEKKININEQEEAHDWHACGCYELHRSHIAVSVMDGAQPIKDNEGKKGLKMV